MLGFRAVTPHLTGRIPIVPQIRVLIADDHRLVRTALAGVLQAIPEIAIVGQAEDGQMAIELTDQLRPDVILMDISMPRLSGIQATRTIVAKHPTIRIVGLSMHDQETLGQTMLDAGAVAFVSKGGEFDSLIETIRRVCSSRNP